MGISFNGALSDDTISAVGKIAIEAAGLDLLLGHVVCLLGNFTGEDELEVFKEDTRKKNHRLKKLLPAGDEREITVRIKQALKERNFFIHAAMQTSNSKGWPDQVRVFRGEYAGREPKVTPQFAADVLCRIETINNDLYWIIDRIVATRQASS